MWWSFFTAATARATSIGSMVVVRFLFGAGEAGCFPNITKAFTTWLPPGERVRAQGVLWLAARWGGAVTPLLVVAVLGLVSSWRRAFELFGVLGLVWAFFFYRWFRDNPHEHPSVNDAEKRLLTGVENLASRHGRVPWRVFVRSRSAWLLWIQYACLSYVWYFYVTWFPTYLERTHGATMGPVMLAVLAGLPLFGGGIGSLISGFCAGALARRVGGVGRARKALAAFGFVAAAVCLLAATSDGRSPLVLAALLGLAGLFNDFALPCAWGACMDVGGRFAGTFSGAMNMMGNLGGFVAPIATGYILRLTGSWSLVFIVSSAVYLLGPCRGCCSIPSHRSSRVRDQLPRPGSRSALTSDLYKEIPLAGGAQLLAPGLCVVPSREARRHVRRLRVLHDGRLLAEHHVAEVHGAGRHPRRALVA